MGRTKCRRLLGRTRTGKCEAGKYISAGEKIVTKLFTRDLSRAVKRKVILDKDFKQSFRIIKVSRA